MASKGVELGLLLVFLMMICHGAIAQPGCTMILMGLAPCLNYVTGNSSTPSSSCCSQLATDVQSQPQCLCAILNGGGSSLGIPINQTLALSLPGACSVQTPPVSRCNGANAPATSPTSSPVSPPADSSDEVPEAPSGPPLIPSIPADAGMGSKTVPTSDGTSGASIMRMQPQLTVILIFFVACA